MFNFCLEKFLKRLVGKNGSGMGDALKRLDRLTQEEALMAAAETWRIMGLVCDGVTAIRNGTLHMFIIPLILNVHSLVRRSCSESNGPTTGEQRG